MHVTRAMIRRAELAVVQYKGGKHLPESAYETQLFLRHILKTALQDVPEAWDDNALEYKEQIDRLSMRMAKAKKVILRARDYIRRHDTLDPRMMTRLLRLNFHEE